jgi:hypothetical protein
MVDDGGNEELLVTLSISNRDKVSVMFDRSRAFEAKITNHWVQVEQAFRFTRLAPSQQAYVTLLMPAGTDACSLRLNYQSEIWKQRLMEAIGLRGRTLLAKSPLLCKWVWPDELRTMRVPPHWKQATLEVAFPRSGETSAGSPGRAHKPGAIISRAESLQIIKNDLRKLALEKHATELKEAGAERRGEILAQIEKDLQKEVRRRARMPEIDTLLY